MSNQQSKPKLTSRELVQKMKNEMGIRFTITKEQAAEKYLLDINNFLRTASYRKNFEKYQSGQNAGKYINLEFAYLQELSSIDMHLRTVLFKLTVDIEHDLKIAILKELEQNASEDGYSIVQDFLKINPRVLKKIESNISSSFTAELIQKYFTIQKGKIISYSDCPLWVLFELITFGDFIYFYVFYYARTNKKPQFPKGVLNLIKNARNACAHNNCLLSDLSRKNAFANPFISAEIAKIPTISPTSRKKNLSSRLLQEVIAVIIVFDKVTSKNIKKTGKKELKNLFSKRMIKRKDYFSNNDLIKNTYRFIFEVVKVFC